MKFKKGKLYRVILALDYSICKGCILRYEGINKNGEHFNKVIKPASKSCHIGFDYSCVVFQNMIDRPNEVKLVEHESMVKFCKKLKKKLDKQRKV